MAGGKLGVDDMRGEKLHGKMASWYHEVQAGGAERHPLEQERRSNPSSRSLGPGALRSLGPGQPVTEPGLQVCAVDGVATLPPGPTVDVHDQSQLVRTPAGGQRSAPDPVVPWAGVRTQIPGSRDRQTLTNDARW